MIQSVALIGAGAMGGAIGARLLETGSRLTVFVLDAEKVAALVEKGTIAANSAANAGLGGEDQAAVMEFFNGAKRGPGQ